MSQSKQNFYSAFLSDDWFSLLILIIILLLYLQFFLSHSIAFQCYRRAQHLSDILSSKGLPAACISGEIQEKVMRKVSECAYLYFFIQYSFYFQVV